MRFLLALFMLGMMITPAWAAFQGPAVGVATSTVREALDATWDDTKMCLEGNIMNKVATSSEKYTFTDASGSIVVDVDDKVMGTVHVTPSTKVRICGEVDRELGRVNQFDAKTLQILQ